MRKGSALIIIVSMVAVLAIAAAAFMYGQNQNLKVKATPAPNVEVVPSSAPAANATVVPTATPKAATVVFEAEGSFSASEKSELKTKIINPLTDYYLMVETSQTLLTLTISKNDQPSKDTYPYKAQAVFQGGGNMGFLIMKSGSGVDWWYPECMVCNLTAAYKAKYPEVAAKIQ